MFELYSKLLKIPVDVAFNQWYELYKSDPLTASIELQQLFIDFLEYKYNTKIPVLYIAEEASTNKNDIIKKYLKQLIITNKDCNTIDNWTVKNGKNLQRLKRFIFILCKKCYDDGYLLATQPTRQQEQRDHENENPIIDIELNFLIALIDFFIMFSKHKQSNEILSYSATYFISTLGVIQQQNMEKLTIIQDKLKRLLIASSSTSSTSSPSSTSSVSHRVNQNIIIKQNMYLTRIIHNLFKILQNSINHIINDKSLLNELLLNIEKNLQFLFDKNLITFYKMLLSIKDITIITNVLNQFLVILSTLKRNTTDTHLIVEQNSDNNNGDRNAIRDDVLMRNTPEMEMLKICIHKDMINIFLTLLSNKSISVERLILLLFIEIHTKINITNNLIEINTIITDVYWNNLILPRLYCENFAIRKLTIKLFKLKCNNNGMDFLKMIIDHFINYENNLNKLNRIFEVAWNYKEFRNHKNLLQLFQEYCININNNTTTSQLFIKHSLIIIKLIVLSSNKLCDDALELFEGKQSKDHRVHEQGFNDEYLKFLILLPNIFQTVHSLKSEILIEELLNIFQYFSNGQHNNNQLEQFNIMFFYQKIPNDFNRLVVQLNHIFFQANDYILLKKIYYIYEKLNVTEVLHEIIGNYLESIEKNTAMYLSTSTDIENYLGIHLRFSIVLECNYLDWGSDEYYEIFENIQIFNLLKSQLAIAEKELLSIKTDDNRLSAINLIIFTNLFLMYVHENNNNNNNVEFSEEQNNLLKFLLKYYEKIFLLKKLNHFYAYSIVLTFCRLQIEFKKYFFQTKCIKYSLKNKIKSQLQNQFIKFLYNIFKYSSTTTQNNNDLRSYNFYLKEIINNISMLYYNGIGSSTTTTTATPKTSGESNNNNNNYLSKIIILIYTNKFNQYFDMEIERLFNAISYYSCEKYGNEIFLIKIIAIIICRITFPNYKIFIKSQLFINLFKKQNFQQSYLYKLFANIFLFILQFELLLIKPIVLKHNDVDETLLEIDENKDENNYDDDGLDDDVDDYDNADYYQSLNDNQFEMNYINILEKLKILLLVCKKLSSKNIQLYLIEFLRKRKKCFNKYGVILVDKFLKNITNSKMSLLIISDDVPEEEEEEQSQHQEQQSYHENNTATSIDITMGDSTKTTKLITTNATTISTNASSAIPFNLNSGLPPINTTDDMLNF